MDLEQHEFLTRRQPPPPPCPDSANVYLCVLCVSLLNDPVQSTCGDRMCRSCVEFLDQSLRQRGISSIRCPGCGEVLTPSQCFPDRAASRDLSVLIVRCPNNCLWEGQYHEYSAHYRVCPRQPQRCPHPSCTMTLPPDEMEQHVVNCRYRPVQCRYCHQEFLSEEVEKHYEMCDQFPIKCTEGYGEEVPRGSLYTHFQDDCPNVTKFCCYGLYGCDFKGLRSAVVEHQANCSKRPPIVINITVVGSSGPLYTSAQQLLTQVMSAQDQTPPPQEPFLPSPVEETRDPYELGHKSFTGQ